ncbi:flagellar motor switch protein FliG [candidate division KSB1 bacterium]|nr:MAG: flagellar motor switch protein FliG [candidate division KSB1 bacterium]RKY88154.1 MAG: flagellar motor switch protein FliG [candidate division KSB1 bacterium]HDI52179.1 flagellar motor switch protein FliG [Bacteroidota bacterium]
MNSDIDAKNLSGYQKAAILLVAVGMEAASAIYKNLSNEDVEKLTREIARLRNIPSSVIQTVIEEFYQMMLAQNYVSEAGAEYARQLLERSLGRERAAGVLQNMERVEKAKTTGFRRLQKMDVDQIVTFLQKEHPQIISVILAHLDAEKAAKVFDEFPQDMQVEVAYRMARLDRVDPELVKEVEQFINSHFKADYTQSLGQIDGQRLVADLLNQASKVTERAVLEGLVQVDPDLTNEIKNLMFVFDDLVLVDDRSMQKILKEVDTKELSLALKGASDSVKEKIFSNMSERAATMLKEELEYIGPVRVKDVEEAQRRILAIVSNLEENGEIVIHRVGGEEDVIL